ncbi:MAG TPA: hypothetical protein PK916_00565 [Bacteroidota bacterium]|nr:hypothetical protein [Bacteroidota bacterium]
MKKMPLPLSESFTVHAVALINKVHQDKPRPQRDKQMDTILMARSRNFSLRQADEDTLLRRIGL